MMAPDDRNDGGSATVPTQEVYFDTATTKEDLQQILSLQSQNLAKNISPEEAKGQGFVTIEHDLATLEELSRPYGHVVARKKKNDDIVGYALTMLPQHRDLVPFLQPILKEIETVTFDDKLVRDLNYCIMGQICIAKDFRGCGIFKDLYKKMSQTMKAARYDYIITGVALNNLRSRRAHEKVGFVPLAESDVKKKVKGDRKDEYQDIVLRL